MFIANIPITATPRTMSRVAMRCPGPVVALIRYPLPPVGRVISDRAPRSSSAPLRAAFQPVLLLRRLRLQLDVILQAHPLDHLELGLEEVDMLLLAGQDRFEQF